MTTHWPIYQMVDQEIKELKNADEYQQFADFAKVGLEDMLPKIQELEPVWISVEERLPEWEAIAIWYQEEQLIGYIAYDTETRQYICESDWQLLESVTHWMKLPNPPTNA